MTFQRFRELLLIGFFGATLLVVGISSASANPILGDTCGVIPGRTAQLTGAAQCAHGIGNPDSADISGYYGSTWTNEGELTNSGTNDWFTVTSADWNTIPASGSYSINPLFWATYGQGVITMHVGGGQADPDHWAWLLTPGTLAGTFDMFKNPPTTGGGGGFSNLKLWGADNSIPFKPLPEPGALGLLGLGLLGLTFSRRRIRS